MGRCLPSDRGGYPDRGGPPMDSRPAAGGPMRERSSYDDRGGGGGRPGDARSRPY